MQWVNAEMWLVSIIETTVREKNIYNLQSSVLDDHKCTHWPIHTHKHGKKGFITGTSALTLINVNLRQRKKREEKDEKEAKRRKK